MKKLYVFLLLNLLFLSGFSQGSCASNDTVYPTSSRYTTDYSFASNDTLRWFSFTAITTRIRIEITKPISASPSTVVRGLELYTGSCGALDSVSFRNIYWDSTSARNAILLIDFDSLVLNQEYYIQVIKDIATTPVEHFGLSLQVIPDSVCTGGNCDCGTPIIVCGSTTVFRLSTGTGFVYQEIPPTCTLGNPGPTLFNPQCPNANPGGSGNMGCMRKREQHTTWLLITVTNPGYLRFNLDSGMLNSNTFNQDGAYDWIIYPYDANGFNNCTNIRNNLVAPILCNWNAFWDGGTGAGSVPFGGHPYNYENSPYLNCGQYMMCFDNFTGTDSTSQDPTLKWCRLWIKNGGGNFCSIGCPSPSTITATANPTSYCVGGSSTLTATGANNLIWTPSTGLSSTTGSPVTASPTVTTTYTVSGTLTGFNCPVTQTVTVTVHPNPRAYIDVSADSICLGESITFDGTGGVGTPPYTYSWNFGDNTSSTDTTVIHTYAASGTYTVVFTVTDVNGCTGTTSITIRVYDPPQPPVISGNTSLCGGTTITYGITNYNPTYTYAVSVVPSLGVTINSFISGYYQITFPSPCLDYVITVNVYNNLTACNNTDLLRVFRCCPCTPLPVDVLAYGTQSNPYLASSLPTTYFSGGVYNNTLGTLYINGYFLVDVNLTIDASQVRFGGGARIDIDSNMTLKIDNGSHLAAGCNYMWDGIYADSPYETVRVTNSSIIEDGENAIVADSGGLYFIDNGAIFNKNYKSIVVKNYTAQNYPGTVEDAFFTCYALYNLPIPSNALIAPYVGSRSYIGIEVTDIDTIVIGNPNGVENLFDNLNVGIGTLRTNSKILNNDFVNITGSTQQFSSIVNGRAIWVVGSYGNVQMNPFSVSVGIANDSTAACTFLKCGYGVFAELLTDVYIRSNIFDTISNTGIYITRLDEPNVVRITDWNVLTSMPRGIWCRNNPFTRILIDGNNVDVSDQPSHLGYGIIVEDITPIKNAIKTTKILKNLVSSVRRGIYVLNQWDSTLIEENYVTCNNTSNSSPPQYTEGIEVLNTTRSIVTNNNVGSTGGADWWMNGVRINGGTANLITCNYVYSIGRGLYFDMPQNPKTRVKANIMEDLETGLLLNQNGTIGPQGFTNATFDNKWQNSFSYANTFAHISFGNLSPFYVQSPSIYNPSTNVDYQGSPIPFTVTTNGNPVGSCPIYSFAGSSAQDEKVALDIIFDSVEYAGCEEAGKWEEEYGLYKYLLSDTAFLNSNQYFIDFKDSVHISNLGILHRITKIAGLPPDAMNSHVSALDSLLNYLPSTTNSLEKLLVTVDSILLSAMSNSTELSQWDVDTLRSIAALCPPCDGPAVFLARSILAEYDSVPFIYLNECEQAPDGSGLRIMGSPEEVGGNFSVYPNPTSGIIILSYILPSTGEIIVYDVTGKKVAHQSLASGTLTVSFDLTYLESGLYFYQVKSNNQKVIKKGKLVLVK